MEKNTQKQLLIAIIALMGFVGGFALNVLSWNTEAKTQRISAQQDAISIRSILDGPWEYCFAPHGVNPKADGWLMTSGALGGLPGWNHHDYLWLKITLPKISLINPVLALYRPFHGLQVWLDDLPVYTYQSGTAWQPFVGAESHLIPIRSGSTLLVRVDSVLSYIGIPELAVITTAPEETARFVLADLDDLVVVILLLLIALSSLVFWFFYRHHNFGFSLIACCLAMGVYTISKTYLKYLIAPAPLGWTIAWLLALFVLPAVFVALLRTLIPGKLLKWLYRLVLLLGTPGILLILAYLFSPDLKWGHFIFTILFAYRIGFQVVILLTGLICLVAVVRLKTPTPEYSIVILQVGLALFFGISASQSTIAFGIGPYGARGNIHVGFACFLLAITIVLIQKIEFVRRRQELLAQKAGLFRQALNDIVERSLVIFDHQGSVVHRNQRFIDCYGADTAVTVPDDQLRWALAGLSNIDGSSIIRIGPARMEQSYPARIGLIAFQNNRAAVYAILFDSANDVNIRIEPVDSLAALLSAREQQVLALAAQGKSNREIGQELFISERTVKAHFSSIFNKLAIGSRRELMAMLLRHDPEFGKP